MIDLTSEGARVRGEVRALYDRAGEDCGDGGDGDGAGAGGGGGEESGGGTVAVTVGDGQKKISAHVTVEGGRRAHKQTIMIELNVLKPGHQLPSDRLARIATATSTVDDSSPSACVRASEDDTVAKFGIGSDFAMAFFDEDEDEDEDSIIIMLGHVLRMKGKSEGRHRKIWREPFLLEDRPDVLVQASWYKAVENQPCTYKLADNDSRPYMLKHVMSIIDLKYDATPSVENDCCNGFNSCSSSHSKTNL